MKADVLPLPVTATESFESLFRSEYGLVVAIAQRILADRQRAEDVAQEAFLSFHRRHPNGAPYAAAWLHRAAAHGALNELRGERRRRQRELASPGPAAEGDPAAEFEDEERRRAVRAALARLSQPAAMVLALRYSGLSYTEVAEAMGIGVGQVGTRLRRAEAALRNQIEGDPR